MSASLEQHRRFFRIVMLGLVAWGLFVALGAFLGPQFWQRPKPSDPAAATSSEDGSSPRTTKFDVRKPVIIITSVGIFLGIWALLLYNRQQKLERAAKDAKLNH